jgi:3-oxoacyl-[acyl-carrier protein] reductase
MQITLPGHPNGTPPVAIVTGASRRQGIGAGIVARLAEAGACVFFTAWRPYDAASVWADDPDGPAQIAAAVIAAGGQADWLEIDLRAELAPATVFDAATARFGPPTILVNNAAHSTHDGWQTLSAAELDAHWQANARATALLSAEFARRWPGGDGGRIVNFSSGQGRGPMPEELGYIMSKGAIEALTVSLAAGVAPIGITVNAINPGPTDTGWMSPDLQVALAPKLPFGRAGLPDDAARLVTFLCSEEGRWLTGQILHSEGGFLRE